ncbi:hypothetical protein K490DRAFT_67083 [Saccharata proteae CBS 121410]|uniref:beta-glucosidase n=1 Tax=Saccharata proteae CBS 121410 TaxID=1314787 RepID=A0A9P4HSZ2_9PEZI|nr:hypothetical protein K490DRAFT_67083 [Saccharata proteae CBS 121410]
MKTPHIAGAEQVRASTAIADTKQTLRTLYKSALRNSQAAVRLCGRSGQPSVMCIRVCDVCIAFINAYSGEGTDHSLLYNEEQDNLAKEVASYCNNTVVVLTTTGPRLVAQWIENDNVTAVFYTGALDHVSGHAMIDVLYGDVNALGRLVHTIAMTETDYGVELRDESVIKYIEGKYLDWKYFDKYNTTPRHESGYGLLHTTFCYSNKVSATIKNHNALELTYAQGANAEGGKEDLWDIVATVSTTVTDSGDIDAAEVVQLYMSYPAAANELARGLRGFEKVNVTNQAVNRL